MKPSIAARWCALLGIAGLMIAGYLTFLHLGLMRGDLLGGAACGGSGALNCHAVTASRWAQALGIPLAFWGLFGYICVLALSLLALQSEENAQRSLVVLWAMALAMVAADAWLLYLMAFKIQYFCLFCLMTYLVNLLVLAVAWGSLKGSLSALLGRLPAALGSLAPWARGSGNALFWGVVLVGLLGTAGVHVSSVFLSRGTLKSQMPQVREYLAKQPRVVVDAASDPSKGLAGARMQLVEFSDFMCPVCQRASKINEVILASRRSDLRIVFKNYPLDMACNTTIQRTPHPGSCQVAAAAECAHLQGKFWQFHDKVFESKPPYNTSLIENDAAGLGLDMAAFRSCMSSGQGMEAVKKDIEEAGKAQVSSTPTYVLNDIVLRGVLSPSGFDDFVQVLEELR
jgi:protein-disulfide isomerase/uncharacterized membrane protein